MCVAKGLVASCVLLHCVALVLKLYCCSICKCKCKCACHNFFSHMVIIMDFFFSKIMTVKEKKSDWIMNNETGQWHIYRIHSLLKPWVSGFDPVSLHTDTHDWCRAPSTFINVVSHTAPRLNYHYSCQSISGSLYPTYITEPRHSHTISGAM